MAVLGTLGAMLPLTVVSGISGEPEGGERFPKWWWGSLLGRLTITADGLSWVPLLPWRHPRHVGVSWSDVSEIRFGQTGPSGVYATGWTSLLVAPSKQKRVLAALEEAGFVLSQNPAWPGDVIAHRPGARPIWRRV